MARLISKCSVLAILALASAVAQNPRAKKPSAAIPIPQAAPSPVPIPQMTPEELPARAPRVSYRDGQLLIDAENASLADVLAAVARETGAQIEEPPNAGNERVVAHLSGVPRRVVADLLDGAKFGYIILSPLEDPAGIQRVIVTNESPGDTRPATIGQAANRRGATMPQAEPGPTPEYQRADGADSDPEAAETAPGSQPPQPEGQKPATASEGAVRPIFSGSDAQRSASADPAQNPGPTLIQQGKPPMEVLQDLYRMRQQMQQQNQPAKPQ